MKTKPWKRGQKVNVHWKGDKYLRQGEIVMIAHMGKERKYDVMDSNGNQCWHNEPMLRPWEDRVLEIKGQFVLF